MIWYIMRNVARRLFLSGFTLEPWTRLFRWSMQLYSSYTCSSSLAETSCQIPFRIIRESWSFIFALSLSLSLSLSQSSFLNDCSVVFRFLRPMWILQFNVACNLKVTRPCIHILKIWFYIIIISMCMYN